MTPAEHIKRMEKCVVDGGLACMLESIGELHAQWDSIDEAMRSDILKLEAIFLTMLNARVKSRSNEQA
ncbi:MAG TPA: hypothetical protein VGM84_22005 [Steroidobacteraceae bacterium]|jgi:hypothetical protein